MYNTILYCCFDCYQAIDIHKVHDGPGCFLALYIFASSPKKSHKNVQCQKSHLWWEWQAETLYMFPKHGFGHTYKNAAWNSHKNMISVIHKFREIILESSQNVSETSPRSFFQPHLSVVVQHTLYVKALPLMKLAKSYFSNTVCHGISHLPKLPDVWINFALHTKIPCL